MRAKSRLAEVHLRPRTRRCLSWARSSRGIDRALAVRTTGREGSVAWARRNSWWVYLAARLRPASSSTTSIPLAAPWPWTSRRRQSLIWTAVVAAHRRRHDVRRSPSAAPADEAAWVLFTVGRRLHRRGGHLVGVPRAGRPRRATSRTRRSSTTSTCRPTSSCSPASSLLVRARSPGRDRAALLDCPDHHDGGRAHLVDLHHRARPSTEHRRHDLAASLVTAAYPMMDILLLGAATRLWFSLDSGRNTSDALHRRHPGRRPGVRHGLRLPHAPGQLADGTVWDLGWFVFYLGMGAAALHPSVAAPVVATTPERAISRGGSCCSWL